MDRRTAVPLYLTSLDKKMAMRGKGKILIMANFKKKYRIESNRLHRWDYSKNGYNFITLITQNRKCNLGKIVQGKIVLSDFRT